MTELRELWPRVRVPPLVDTPALARLAVGALWLLLGLLGRPLTTTVLLAVAVAVLVVASGLHAVGAGACQLASAAGRSC